MGLEPLSIAPYHPHFRSVKTLAPEKFVESDHFNVFNLSLHAGHAAYFRLAGLIRKNKCTEPLLRSDSNAVAGDSIAKVIVPYIPFHKQKRFMRRLHLVGPLTLMHCNPHRALSPILASHIDYSGRALPMGNIDSQPTKQWLHTLILVCAFQK